MADFGESLEELQAKLDQYREQLGVVEKALKTQPDEHALIKLQSDLQEVISLTEDLIAFQRSQQPHSSVSSAKHKGDNSAVTDDALGAVDEVGGHITATTGRIRHSAAGSLVGRTCQTVFQNSRFYAEILQIKRDPKLGERAVVEFIGWKNREEYPVSQLQLLQPPPAALCVPGAQVQALYSVDGKWYDCTIDEQTQTGYVVKYQEYGNTEEVKFDQVRMKGGGAKKEASRKKIHEIITPAGYRIPEHMAIKETDTEQVKNLKKRKIQNLKKQQRIEHIDEEAKAKANCWRKFTQKTNKKKPPGFITGRPRQSIFKSSDEVHSKHTRLQATVQAAKLAQSFVPRRKHDFEEKDED